MSLRITQHLRAAQDGGHMRSGLDAKQEAPSLFWFTNGLVGPLEPARLGPAGPPAGPGRGAGDIPGALWAARQGLLAVDKESDTVYRARFLAHHAADDIDALREATTRLRNLLPWPIPAR